MDGQTLPIHVVIICLLHTFPTAISLDGQNVRYAQPDELDFVAALAYSNRHIPRVFNVFCSGVLVSRRHVLTNEHCIKDKKYQDLVVYVGSQNLEEAEDHTVCNWVMHHNYLEMIGQQPIDLGLNDIAIAQLCRDISAIKLKPPVFSWLTLDDIRDSSLTISGWGLARDHRTARLQKGTVKLLDQAKCGERTKLRAVTKARLFCTTACPFVLGCMGDSGGPILDKRNRIVGMTSSLHIESSNPDRALNLHVNITFYKDFITTIVNNLYDDDGSRG